jgi:hypothetical protein
MAVAGSSAERVSWMKICGRPSRPAGGKPEGSSKPPASEPAARATKRPAGKPPSKRPNGSRLGVAPAPPPSAPAPPAAGDAAGSLADGDDGASAGGPSSATEKKEGWGLAASVSSRLRPARPCSPSSTALKSPLSAASAPCGIASERAPMIRPGSWRKRAK